MRISYITSHGIAEWVSASKCDDGFLNIQFTPKCNGAITLGVTTFNVEEGRASIPLSALTNGEYRPKLEADTGVFIAEGFYKNWCEVSMLPTEEIIIRKLVSRYHTLEKTCDTLREKVAHLEAMCQGHSIFDYERMKK